MAVEARRRRGSKSVSEEKYFLWNLKLVKCWQKCFVVRGYYVENDYALL
jgi:hypothetical protein